MKAKPFKLPTILLAFASASCAPQKWNDYAEFLPASSKSNEELAEASIQEYIAEIPPAKVFARNQEALETSIASAPTRTGPESIFLTLKATEFAPERRFYLNKSSNDLRMEVVRPDSDKKNQIHHFQRQSSDWYYWMQS
jgi:hypothetical protein